MRVLVLALAIATAGAAPISNESAPLRPNIVWIMADDMGWGEPGLYPSTSPHGRISTPHLDAFGKSGVQFTEAYAGYTVCAPSRATLMTGFHVGHFEREGIGGSLDIPQDILTTPRMLQLAGYSTGAFGKVAPLTDPIKQGFDVFVGQVDQGLCHNMYPRFIDSGNLTQNVNLTGNWAIPSVITHPEQNLNRNQKSDLFKYDSPETDGGA